MVAFLRVWHARVGFDSADPHAVLDNRERVFYGGTIERLRQRGLLLEYIGLLRLNRDRAAEIMEVINNGLPRHHG